MSSGSCLSYSPKSQGFLRDVQSIIYFDVSHPSVSLFFSLFFFWGLCFCFACSLFFFFSLVFPSPHTLHSHQNFFLGLISSLSLLLLIQNWAQRITSLKPQGLCHSCHGELARGIRGDRTHECTHASNMW